LTFIVFLTTFAQTKVYTKMNVSQKVVKQLTQIPEGSTFRYQDMGIEAHEFGAAAKSIERLIAAGTLKRASKGVFYKPKLTVFGIVKPREEELMKQYLFKNGQRIAYITGSSLYNKMGLTMQVPFNITIASKTRRTTVSIGTMKIRPAWSYADVTNENYYLLGLLDAIKDFNSIPDKDSNSVITILTNRVKELNSNETKEVIQYALMYPPRVRALFGAILENADKTAELDTIRRSLSPLSKYKYGIKNSVLTNASKWNLT
jgi:Family of unknown function (DUF6088)